MPRADSVDYRTIYSMGRLMSHSPDMSFAEHVPTTNSLCVSCVTHKCVTIV